MYALLVGQATQASADFKYTPTVRVSTSLYGKPGIVEMPNALFHGTGEISMTGMLKNPDNRVTLNFQPLPWFEGSFRYSIVEGFFDWRTSERDLFDRSFDFKIRVADQGPYWPAIAVGAQDFAGTGIYSAEYVVATWQTENFNITGGVGFGRFASRGEATNPLALAFDRAKTRDSFDGSVGGTGRIRFGQYFQGEDMGVFGGIEYMTPIDGLKLSVEYSADAYNREEEGGIEEQNSPINVGASYRMNENVEFGVAYVNGNTFAFRLTIQTNPLKEKVNDGISKGRFLYEIRDSSKPSSALKISSDNQEFAKYRAAVLTKNQRIQEQQPLSQNDYLSPTNVWRPYEKPNGVEQEPDPRYVASSGGYGSADTRFMASLGQTERTTEPVAPEVVALNSEVAGESGPAASELDSSTSQANSSNTFNEVSRLPNLKTSVEVEEVVAGATNAPTLEADLISKEELEELAEVIRAAARAQSISVQSVGVSKSTLMVAYSNYKYHRESEAIGRLLPILTQVAADDIEVFRLTLTDRDLSMITIEVPRGSLERIVGDHRSAQELFNVSTFTSGGRQRPRDMGFATTKFPRFDYGLQPRLFYSLFDPDDPLRYGVTLTLRADINITDGLSINGGYRYNVYDNFDEITRKAGSVLPHVRTDHAQYLNESEHGVETLVAKYRWKPGDSLYARHYVGYLEDMYAGVGSEVLYAPHDKRWAAAIELNYVRKRDFDRGFGLQDYSALTGFAKFYYMPAYQDLRFQVDVGRYLAKDYGATFRVTRTFDNGIEVGAFATFTDVPFDEFGEGSFDKGITFRIPFHTLTPFDSKRVYKTDIRPLTRDGGAQVWSGQPLYDTVSPYSLNNLVRTWRAVFAGD